MNPTMTVKTMVMIDNVRLISHKEIVRIAGNNKFTSILPLLEWSTILNIIPITLRIAIVINIISFFHKYKQKKDNFRYPSKLLFLIISPIIP